MKENAREMVLNMLMSITEEKVFSHRLIKDVLDKYNYWENRDKDFVKRLTEGTLERLIQIDYCLDQFSKVKTGRMKPLIRNLLRMSVYQILFMDGVPDRAACDEGVKLAGKRGFRNLQGFVNGVLRTIVREKEQIEWPDEGQDPVRFLSVMYSMPVWLVEKWIEELGCERTKALLAGLLAIRPVTLRLRGDLAEEKREQWLANLKADGVEVSCHPYLSYAYDLYHAGGIRNLPGFQEGYFVVQDIGSMLVTEAAGIGPEDRVLDVCAAPGGKALHAAERAGRVEARDISRAKTVLIRENAARMNIRNLYIKEGDARMSDEESKENWDIVLADLPCSGLGVMGRKRDIKYNSRVEGIRELAVLQREILSVVWQYVKPGGVLIYSTCTISREENEEMMEWFTDRFPFVIEAFPDRSPEPFQESQGGMLQLLPGIHPSDGFFICRLRRFM